MCFSLGLIFEVFPTNTIQALQQHSNTESPYLAETRRQQKANLISLCQSEPLTVRSLGLLWIRGFDVGLLGDRAAAQQPLGSSPARPRCACDSPGPRLPEGLLALWENKHVQHPHGQSSSSLPGSDDCWYEDKTSVKVWRLRQCKVMKKELSSVRLLELKWVENHTLLTLLPGSSVKSPT